MDARIALNEEALAIEFKLEAERNQAKMKAEREAYEAECFMPEPYINQADYSYVIINNTEADFDARVYDNSTKAEVFEIHADHLGNLDIVGDGLMVDGYDINGLQSYLRDAQVIGENETVAWGLS